MKKIWLRVWDMQMAAGIGVSSWHHQWLLALLFTALCVWSGLSYDKAVSQDAGLPD